MQRITKTQLAAVALVVGTLMASLVDSLFGCRLASHGLSLRDDEVLLRALFSVGRWLLTPADPSAPGAAAPSPADVLRALTDRVTYPFVHAHPLHALVNGWVFLQVAFRTRLRARHFFLAFVVAWSCPAVVAAWQWRGLLPASAVPPTVVGLSGVVYALLGMWMPYVACRLRYNAIILLWIVAAALAGSVAVSLHLYCYLMGAFLTKSLFARTKRASS